MSVIQEEVDQRIKRFFTIRRQIEENRKRLEALRTEGVIIDDSMIEQKSALPPRAFAREYDRVRQCYSRRKISISGPIVGPDPFGPEHRKAVVLATRAGISYSEARKRIGVAP